MAQTGKVVKYDATKGYGWIKRTGARDLFVHIKSVGQPRPAELVVGDELAFDEELGPKGARAVNVRLVGLGEREDWCPRTKE